MLLFSSQDHRQINRIYTQVTTTSSTDHDVDDDDGRKTFYRDVYSWQLFSEKLLLFVNLLKADYLRYRVPGKIISSGDVMSHQSIESGY